MTHYKRYSLHLGCGEPLAAQYQPTQVAVIDKKDMGKKPAQRKTNKVTGRKRK